DDYAALPDVDPTAVRQMDDTLTPKADLVFVASGKLLEGKRALNANSHVSPHGVDYDHFVKAQDPALETPADIAHLPRPLIGSFALIARWIERDPVADVSRAPP